MDANLAQRRASLEEKIPDIKKTLDMVEYLQERRVRLNLDLNLAMVLTLCFCVGRQEQGFGRRRFS